MFWTRQRLNPFVLERRMLARGHCGTSRGIRLIDNIRLNPRDSIMRRTDRISELRSKSIVMNMLNVLGFIGGMRGQELLLIALVVLCCLAGGKIPELMRGLGRGMKEFKDASSGNTKNTEGTEKEAE